MTDTEIREKVKKGLGITGDYQDDTLNVYIDEVKAFMHSAGISESVITSDVAVGCIMRGVSDLWNYGSGKFSEYFRMRLLQLKNARIATINPGAGTTLSVVRNCCSLSSGAVVMLGDVLTIFATGGSITVNGKSFKSGNSMTVTENLSIVSIADEV